MHSVGHTRVSMYHVYGWAFLQSQKPFRGEKQSKLNVSFCDTLFAHSRNLLKNLVRVIGSPDLICTPLERIFSQAELHLMCLERELDTWPEIVKTNSDAFYPLESFFHSEAKCHQETLSLLAKEVAYLLKVSRGYTSCTRDALQDLLILGKNQVPESWQVQSFPVCTSVDQWTNQLRAKARYLEKYVNNKEGAAVYNMAAFMRPDRFIQCVLQSFVRKEFKILQNCDIDVQVK